MKTNKLHRVQFRCNREDYIFLQMLKDKNISISSFILNSFKQTEKYKNYYKMLNG